MTSLAAAERFSSAWIAKGMSMFRSSRRVLCEPVHHMIPQVQRNSTPSVSQSVADYSNRETDCLEMGSVAMLITDQGTLVRFKVSELSIIGRNTQGVRLINVSAGERVVGMQRIDEIQDDELPEGEALSINDNEEPLDENESV